MARVILNEVRKEFRGERGRRVRAVNGVCLEAGEGELVAIVGPSGCGKTTLLRLIAGLERPDSGSITLDGAPLETLAAKDRDVAMVFQTHALFPHLTAYENLAFGLALRRTPKPEIDRRVREAAAMLGLEELLDRCPQALSGGECQRVALGRALVRSPRVFLFDEPLSNLDPPSRARLREEVLKVRRQSKAAMVYVTHDLAEAGALADRVALMRDGAIEQTGPLEEIRRNPASAFVAAFVGAAG